MTRPLLAVALALLCAERPLAAQVGGQVADELGNPIAHALVDLWSSTTRLGSQVTGSDGRFLFTADRALGATALLARAIGFGPKRLPLGEHRLALRIELTRFARTLEAVTVDARPLCPNREDPAARALWHSLSRRYAPFRPAQGYRSGMRTAESRVAPTELGMTDTSRLASGTIGASPAYFAQQTARVAKYGYGFPFAGTGGRFDRWEYPYLESLFAGHFIDSLFGALHRLSLDPGATTPVIVFCPRSHKHPEIEGSMELDRDSSLAKITWQLRTPPPVEEAGGQVLFVRAPQSQSPTTLLPAVGLAWRRLLADYYQLWMQFDEWRPCGSGSLACN